MSLLFGRQSVDHTSELDRIIQIPRRTWTEEELLDLASDMTALLKTPNGTMTLRPMQALALHDLYCHGGLAALMRVGAGKTMVSLLAPYMVDAVRPLLLLPAALIGKTETDLQRLRQHWRIPGNIRMLSYEMLGREQSALILCDPDNPAIGYRPDLIVADECFAGDTLVQTPSGPVRIDEIREGDKVWSYGSDGFTQETVLHAWSSVKLETLNVTIGGTARHLTTR